MRNPRIHPGCGSAHTVTSNHRYPRGPSHGRDGSAGLNMAEPVIISSRTWIVEGVPRHAGGHGERDPRRHGRRRDHRRRRRTRARSSDHPGRVRWHRPAASTARWSTTSAPTSPSTRCSTTRVSQSAVPRELPGARPRSSAAQPHAKTAIARGEKLMQSLPLRGNKPQVPRRHSNRSGSKSRNGPSSTVELTVSTPSARRSIQVDNLLSLWTSLDDVDQAQFLFDPHAVDWPAYIHEIHLPSIVDHARVKSTPGKARSTDRMVRLRKQVLDPKRHVAALISRTR